MKILEMKKTSHDAEKIHEVKKRVFEAEKAVRQKKCMFAAEKSCSLFQNCIQCDRVSDDR